MSYDHYLHEISAPDYEGSSLAVVESRKNFRDRLQKEHTTYHRRALGQGVKGKVFVVPDQVFENPRAYTDVMFTIRQEDSPKVLRRATVSKTIWVEDTTHIALKIS